MCLTLCHPVDYTDHGILQARILEWVAFPFSRGSSQTRDWTQVSLTAGGFFTSWAMREAQMSNMTCLVGKLPFAATRSCCACWGYLWGPLVWNWNWKRCKKMDTWALLVNSARIYDYIHAIREKGSGKSTNLVFLLHKLF